MHFTYRMFARVVQNQVVFTAPLILAFALAVGACAPRIHNQGHDVDREQLAQIELGKTNRDQVVEILGSPSSNSTFGPEIWYYVSQEVHSTLFFKPEVNGRKVVAVEFNEEGIVSDVSTLGLEDGRKIRLVERVTPTTGHELTVLEQILGNFGRFSRKKTGPQVGGGGGIPPR